MDNPINNQKHEERKSENISKNSWHIKCGRFDREVPKLSRKKDELSQLRRVASRPPSKAKKHDPILIATNGAEIYDNGKWEDARDYISKLVEKEKKRLMVLTQKEKHLLFDIEVETNCRINCFETAFPLFDDIAHFSAPAARISYMKKSLIWLEKKGVISSSIGKHNSLKNQYKTARKVRFKNGLDMWFAFSSQVGIQEVFKTHDFRNGRNILAFDFNSMYPSCMEGEFPDPRNLEHHDYTQKNINIEKLPEGLYRAHLAGFINEKFKNIHPFRYKVLNDKTIFKGSEETTIECLLHKKEINAYKKYFKEIKIIEGIVSKNTIRHPLENHAKKLFKELQNYKKQGATRQYNFTKKELQSLYSATSRREYKTTWAKSYDELSEFLKENFYININDCITRNQENKVLNSKYILATTCGEKIKIRHVNFSSDFNLHSLTSQVISNARVKMIKTMEHILSFNSTELCYANTDSIHVSIPKRNLPAFIEHMSPFISDKMGGLKVQCIADKGLWLDVGRYWLLENGNVELYKNKVFNHKNNRNPFTRFRKLKKAHYAQAFSYVSIHAITIENSLDFSKRLDHPDNLDHSDLVRYGFEEVKDLDVAGETYFNEEKKSRTVKLELLKRVATK